MTMNDYNAALIQGVLAAIAGLEQGNLALSEVQAVLQSSIQLIENDGSGIGAAVRLAEADLEEIQFTTLLDEQRHVAIFRLDRLRTAIEDASDA